MKSTTSTARIPGGFAYSNLAFAPSRDALFDFAARATIVSLFTLLVIRIARDFVATGRVTGLLMLGSESLVVVLTLIRRAPEIVDRSWQSRVVTALSMVGPPLLIPVVGRAWISDAMTAVASAIGLFIVIVAKISLGRSFGLLPANRGVVSRGCYRLLRHPIYLGYLVGHVSFLAANPSPWNVGLLAVSDLALLRRAIYEERTLARDDQYRSYMDRVRWRLIPGVF